VRDAIHIQGLRLDCIVGVRPAERQCEQPVALDLRLGLDLSRAGRSGRIAHTCDYDRVVDQVSALLKFRRYRLVEVAVEELAAMLFGVHPMLERVWIRLEKPKALDGRARLAAVEIERERSDFPSRREDTPFGEVEILHETREAGLYRLHVDVGHAIQPHFHRVMQELEWLVFGRLLRDGEPVNEFDPAVWPRGKVHTYVNEGQERATLFCCDSPPFIPEDEILVETASGREGA
jgi:dihydroneopterin aldolase